LLTYCQMGQKINEGHLTLTLWRTLFLVQRIKIFSIRLPGRQISVSEVIYNEDGKIY
jgi:hypothetical protein